MSQGRKHSCPLACPGQRRHGQQRDPLRPAVPRGSLLLLPGGLPGLPLGHLAALMGQHRIHAGRALAAGGSPACSGATSGARTVEARRLLGLCSAPPWLGGLHSSNSGNARMKREGRLVGRRPCRAWRHRLSEGAARGRWSALDPAQAQHRVLHPQGTYMHASAAGPSSDKARKKDKAGIGNDLLAQVLVQCSTMQYR